MKNYIFSTKFLTMGLFLIGLLVLIVGGAIGQLFFAKSPPSAYMKILLIISIAFLITGTTFVVLRREMPRGGKAESIKGFWAVFWGSLSLLLLVGSEAYLILSIISEIK